MFKHNKVAAVLISLMFVAIIAGSVLAGVFLGNRVPVSENSSVDSTVQDTSSWVGDTSSDSLSDTSSGGSTVAPPDEGAVILPVVKVDTSEVEWNIPDELRAAYVQAGVDFLKKSDDTETRIRADIETAIRTAKDLSLNTILLDTVLDGESVIFSFGNLPVYNKDFDILDFAIKKAREYDLHIYAVVSPMLTEQNGKLIPAFSNSPVALESVKTSFSALATTYKLDGVVIKDYFFTDYEGAYADYQLFGNGMGFEAYKYFAVKSCVETAARAVRDTNNDIQVVLYVDGVWKNASSDEDGTATSAAFEAYYDGFADTKSLAEGGCFDAIMVESFGSITANSIPFEPILKWWNTVADTAEAQMYVMQASSKACTDKTGWQSPDQLTKQFVAARKQSNFKGSCFDSLTALKNDPQGSTTALIQYFDNEESDDLILKELVVTKPAKKSFTTAEPLVQFSGASAPLFDLVLNNEKIERDETGMFSLELELKPGTNTFTFEHKGKTIQYDIVREVDVIKDVTPMGSISVEGGDRITVSALAYKGSEVSASLNGQTVKLSVDETQNDNTDTDSNYQLFSGSFTAPAATASEQSLGEITFTAKWDSLTESAKGAGVKVNKRVQAGSGSVIVVTADAAETFPTNVVNDYSHPDYFPLPKGTVDRVAGGEIVYVEDGKTYRYYKLESGLRVYTKDIKFESATRLPSNNKITGLKVTADDTKTKVILSTDNKVPFKVDYTGNAVSFKFSYTTTTPVSLKLTKNPLFSAADWSGSTLTLRLKTTNGFLGFKSYYSGNNLVLEFNNPLMMQSSSNGYGYSLRGTRIAIDSGHGGGNNPGAVGVHPKYPEAVINQAITKRLKNELEALGASVLLIDSVSTDPSLESRVQQAKNFNAHMMISIHQNSAVSSKATGSEAFYFNDYSKKLAEEIASRLYGAVGTNNRGAKFGYYYVTRDTQFPATLVECGFISNSEEHYKLIQDSTQQDIAEAIVKSVIAYGKATGGASSFATGTESVGTVSHVPGDESSSQTSSTPSSTPSSSESSEDTSLPESSRPTVIPNTPTFMTGEMVKLTLTKQWVETEILVALGTGDGAITRIDVEIVDDMGDTTLQRTNPTFKDGVGSVWLRMSKKGVYTVNVRTYDKNGNRVVEQGIVYTVQ